MIDLRPEKNISSSIEVLMYLVECVDCGRDASGDDVLYCFDCGRPVCGGCAVFCYDCGVPLCMECGHMGLCSGCEEAMQAEEDLVAMEEGF